MTRQRWSSRTVFILAAVGSAVGLGNIWRFPYLTAQYGGGAFLLPYLIALIVVGVPLLALEIGVGQRMQRGAIGSFRRLSPSFGGLGLFALLSAFAIVSYYAVVMAWSLFYVLASFRVSWGDDPEAYFNQQALQASESIAQIGGINWPIFGLLVAVWVAVYFSVWRGTQSLGQIVLYSVPLPALLLLILLGRAMTLPGFLDGWALYLNPDLEALRDPEVWRAAFSQIFFTLTLAFGLMVAYASYRDEGQDVVQDTWITALLNSAVSLIAGFVVFGILGYMATQVETPLAELAQQSGPGLAFVVFPQALDLMPLSALFGVLFFLTLFLLGLDSAFSLVAAINTAVLDTTNGRARTPIVSFWVCLLGFLAGIIYTTQAGQYFLDVVDHFVTGYNLLLVGACQAILVGWIYGAEKMRRQINEVSRWQLGRWWNLAVKYVIPIALVALVAAQLSRDLGAPYGDYPAWAIGIGWAVVIVPVLVFVLFLLKDRSRQAAPADRS
ncbi:MAG: sodium-dependent transporter [Cyanobacteria bacterium QS_8_64_29]|nr:MAG: sodium-dependent transporter [Cyanobacteria bacterium QS_8_64_29]